MKNSLLTNQSRDDIEIGIYYIQYKIMLVTQCFVKQIRIVERDDMYRVDSKIFGLMGEIIKLCHSNYFNIFVFAFSVAKD